MALVSLLLTQAGATTSAAATDGSVTIQQIDASQFPVVHVQLSVLDGQSVPVQELTSTAVAVDEDGQSIGNVQLEPIEDAGESIAAALVIQHSNSMANAGKLATARTLAVAFIDAMGPQDTAAVLGFTNSVDATQTYTSNKAVLKEALDKLAPGGDAAIFDALSSAIQFERDAPQQRKLILVLSDGQDTRVQPNDAARLAAARSVQTVARAAPVPVFVVGIGDDANWQILNYTVTATNQAMGVMDAAHFQDAFRRVIDELRSKYVLTYTSVLAADGNQHDMHVRVTANGEALVAQGTLATPLAPLAIDVQDNIESGHAAGIHRTAVSVTEGVATRVDLLVDEQPRASSETMPYVLQWDAANEPPGVHHVLVRASGSDGASAEQEYDVEIPAQPVADPVVLAVAGLAALVVLSGLAAGLVLLRRRRSPGHAIAANSLSDSSSAIVGGHSPGDRSSTARAPASVLGASGGGRPERLLDARPAPPSAANDETILAPRARVRVVEKGVTREVLFRSAELTVGRGPDNDVVVQDSLASRHHARFVIDREGYSVEDLSSRNGTWVNGAQVKRRTLADRDEIRVGSVVLTFLLGSS
ncbi:MAG: FHA domain-containing protein [Chloroflexi bacterium]|nr:FHA domain-containing protein [Chloroflexota bacterium]